MFKVRPRALIALALDALEVLCRVCCDDVIIHVLRLCDGGVVDFGLGLEPVKVEESTISSVHNWNTLW